MYYSDYVAIPGRTGAMENWGLALSSENNLLYNPNWDSLADQRQIARVIGHELAHFVSNTSVDIKIRFHTREAASVIDGLSTLGMHAGRKKERKRERKRERKNERKTEESAKEILKNER